MVDDEPDVRHMYVAALRRGLYGATIRACATAEEARAILDAERVDLLITDHHLGGTSGIDLIRDERARRPGLPCILLTGYADKALALRAINEAGVVRCIEKPWPMRAAIVEIETLLKEQRAAELRARAFASAIDVAARRLTREQEPRRSEA